MEKTPQVIPILPNEHPKSLEVDLGGMKAGIGLDAPAQIRAAPWSDSITAGCFPEEPDHGVRAAEERFVASGVA